MTEDVIIIFDFDDRTVVVPGIGYSFCFIDQPDIAIVMQDAFLSERTFGIIGHGVT